jgi:AraC-like DNA-binding protein
VRRLSLNRDNRTIGGYPEMAAKFEASPGGPAIAACHLLHYRCPARGLAMRVNNEPLLERLRIFQSRSAEETRAFLNAKDYAFDVDRDWAAGLDTRINGVYVPDGYFGYVQYGSASVRLAPCQERSDYWIQLPVRGRLNATIGREHVTCDPRRAAIASPMHERCLLESEPESTRIQFALGGAAVLSQLETLLWDSVRGPVAFAPAIDLSAGHGKSLARYIRVAIADLEQPQSLLLNPATMRAFVQFLAIALLRWHPHNYSEAMQRRGGAIAPRDVKRAVDYIEANLENAVSLTDIVRAAGVPGRTLFEHFRSFKGLTPLQYVRNRRFQMARQLLLRSDAEASITTIATNCGFTHMGRFATEYRRRFGERPSETLRQRPVR